MDIYSYLNSKDVEKYLRKIKYQFDPIQMAWIVWHSKNVTMKEKHKAWNDIIAETDDVKLKEHNDMHVVRDSFHSFLKECIEFDLKRKERFELKENNAIYRYKYIFKNSNICYFQKDYEKINESYSDYHICLKSALSNIVNEKSLAGNIQYIEITKYYIDGESWIRNVFDIKGRLMWDSDYTFEKQVYEYLQGHTPSDLFNYLCYDIPVPFQKGDIVINKYNNINNEKNRPFVYTEKNLDLINYEYATEQDMLAVGYMLFEDGKIYYKEYGNYLDMEYYKEKLIDKYKVLLELSHYFKGKIILGRLIENIWNV